MEALQGVTSALSGAVTPEEVGQAVAEHGARALGGTGGIVFTMGHQRAMLHVIGSWGYSDAELRASSELPLSVPSPAGEAARQRRTVAVAPADMRTRYAELAAALPGANALCAVPLLAGSEVLGAVGVSRSEPRAFDGAEIALLEALGRQGGQALERARLYDRLHRLQATTAALARALTPQEVAATAAAQGAEALGASSAWVALLDEGTRTLELAHAAGHETDDPAALRLVLARRRAATRARRAHGHAAVAGESGRDLRPVPALRRGPPAGAGRGAAAAVRRRCCARRDRAGLRSRARLPAARPRLPARADAAVRAGAGARAALPGRARPGGDAPAGAAAGVAAGGGRAGTRCPLPPGHRRRVRRRRLLRGRPARRWADGDRGRRCGRARAGGRGGDGPAAQRTARLRARGPGARARAAAALALRRRRGRCARRDARLRDRGPGRAPVALRLGRPSAAAAGDRRGRAALPGGGARSAAGPLARLRLRGRRRRLAGFRDADPVLRRGDRAPRGAARRGNGAARRTRRWRGRAWSRTRSAAHCSRH